MNRAGLRAILFVVVGLIIGGFAVFFFAAFPEVIFGTRTFVFRDFGNFAYPLAFHQREAFWRGGFAAMEKLATEFERLWSAHRS